MSVQLVPGYFSSEGLPGPAPAAGLATSSGSAIATAENLFRKMADAAPLMIWMSAADAHCIFVNASWLEFRGRTLEQGTGNGWVDGLHPDDRDLCLETYLKAFSARQPFRMQYRLRRADGEFRWIE